MFQIFITTHFISINLFMVRTGHHLCSDLSGINFLALLAVGCSSLVALYYLRLQYFQSFMNFSLCPTLLQIGCDQSYVFFSMLAHCGEKIRCYSNKAPEMKVSNLTFWYILAYAGLFYISNSCFDSFVIFYWHTNIARLAFPPAYIYINPTLQRF